MIKAFKFKLYHAKRNKKLHNKINIAGLIYNHCIALHKRYWHLYHKSLNLCVLQKHITKLKKIKRFNYLKELNSQTVQDITERIDRGYKLFWKNLKNKKKTAPPKFRKIWKYKSITFKQSGWKLDEEHGIIYIQKQKYRYSNSRNVNGKIKIVTIKRDTLGDLYIYFVCELPNSEVKAHTGKSVGFDFGFKGNMLVAENEIDDIKAPSFFKETKNKIAKANRNLSSKKLKSNNQKKARLELARLYRKITNKRNDYHWKLSKYLCKKYSIICLENLNMKWMQRNHGKKVMDYGFYAFTNILEYIAKQNGTQIIKVDRFFPSSQICSDCGFQNKEVKNLSIREWTCPNCGEHHDRDRNAARNIHNEGLKMIS